MKDCVVFVYIEYYKEEFVERYILWIFNGEILMSDYIFGLKWGILEVIIQNYFECQDVKEYFLINYFDDYRFVGQIIVKYYGFELVF